MSDTTTEYLFDTLMACRWSTVELTGIAWRVTPRQELTHWVATQNGVWYKVDPDHYQLMNHAQLTGRVYHIDDLREFVCEQLAHYGVDVAAINYMKS